MHQYASKPTHFQNIPFDTSPKMPKEVTRMLYTDLSLEIITYSCKITVPLWLKLCVVMECESYSTLFGFREIGYIV